MMTAVGVIVAGSSTMSVAAQAMPMQPDPISKSQQILDASKFIQGLNDSCGTGNTGGKVQEAQFYPFGNYFNNWANWQNQ
jgi:hypothetical protein